MNRQGWYVDVAPAVPLPARGRSLYTYRLPKDGGERGEDILFRAVEIPFGGRRVRGVIMAVHATPPAFPTQPIRRLSQVRLTPQQVGLARWIASTMQGGLGFTLRLFLPPRL